MRERILTILSKEETRKCKVDDFKALLDVSSSEGIKELIKTLNKLTEEAIVIENNAFEYTLIKHTNYVVGQLDLKEKGFGFVMVEDSDVDDVFIRKEEINGAMNLDRVLVYLSKNKTGVRPEGTIKRVIERKYTHIIGTLKFIDGMGRLISDDKTIKQEIMIRNENLNNARKFDKVQAQIINYDFKGKIECKVTQVIGNINQNGVDILSKIIKYNIDPVFSDEVVQAASKFENVTKEDMLNRRDLREEMIITIDGDDSKDFDDAVIVKKLPNGN
ncbi:MAG: hypothetical protein KJ847_01810, partial [Firmicutes bacterium]|nr:hypothetical protein [Bacillota bacterium]